MNSTNTLRKEDSKEFTVDKTKVEMIKEIDINTSVADVELIQSDDYYVEIDYTYWEETPEYTVEDGVLRFDDSDSFPNSYSINFSLHNSVKIYIPETAAFDQISMDNSSGNITAEGFVADQFDVTISSGNLTLENAAAAECEIRLSSGTSKITDFNTGKMDFTNSSGNVKFKNINTDNLQLLDNIAFDSFQLSMSSGNIDISGLNTKSTDISNSSGNITCEDIVSDEFDASVSSGNIEINNSDLKDINVSNVSGDVTLSLNQTKEDYAMDLSTSNGTVKVDGQNYDNHLVQENGGTRKLVADVSHGNVTIDFE